MQFRIGSDLKWVKTKSQTFHHINLGGAWATECKHMRQIGSFPYVGMKIKMFQISNHDLVRYILIPTYSYNKVAKANKISCTIQSTSHFFHMAFTLQVLHGGTIYVYWDMSANILALFFLAATTKSIEPGTFCGLQLLLMFWLYSYTSHVSSIHMFFKINVLLTLAKFFNHHWEFQP